MAWDDAAVLEGGIMVGTSVEADGLDITVGSTEGVDAGIDVWVEAEGTRLGVEVGVVEDAGVEVGVVEDNVVDGGTDAALLEVEEMAASVVVGIT